MSYAARGPETTGPDPAQLRRKGRIRFSPSGLFRACGTPTARTSPTMDARARQKLEKLKERIASGDLKRPEKIGAAVERIMQKYHGYRYFDWKLEDGLLEYSESGAAAWSRKEDRRKICDHDQREGIERPRRRGDVRKELTDVESGFRRLKDVLAMRSIDHRVEPRVKAPIFVAALALLVQRLLGRRLNGARVDLSPERAMQALSTVRMVSFRLDGQPERRGITGGCPDARLVLKALKLVDQRPPSPPEGEETVM